MSTDAQRLEDPPPGGPMSVEEYLQLDRNFHNGKYEYVDGVAQLLASGSKAHDIISRNTINAIDIHFRSGPCSVSGSDMQVLIGTRSNGKKHFVYPDATVSCDLADRRLDNTLIRSPRIIVEILSPSTEKKDKGSKLRAYKACPTIQEVMLIDQFTQFVELHRRNDDDVIWSRITYDNPDAVIELTSVDVTLSMRDIYKGINFDNR